MNKDNKNTILLHCCCAPCSSYVLEYLASDFEITCVYYNPCITDKNEYYKRLGEFEKLNLEVVGENVPGLDLNGKMDSNLDLNSIKIIDGGYEPDTFYTAIKGYENEPEHGKRCEICFKMRLAKTFELKQRLNFDCFATTLTVSPHKNAAVINSIGSNFAGYMPSDFKKKNGYKRSIELSKQYDLYRQVYCGCSFSQ